MELALKFVEQITSNYSKTTFEDLCKSIAELITTISNPNDKKPDLFLYFNQLFDCLQLLARIITEEYEQKIILKESRKSVQKRILFCLDKISDTKSKSSTRQLGCFINWMNNALERIKNVNVVNNPFGEFVEVKILFEDILSNALSIAQISLDEDSKAIKGSCQSVLDALRTLETHLNQDKTNKAMIQLFIDNCGDKLCSLERRLDMAILRLTLEVFSKNSIEKLFKENNSNEFDLYIDRLMQIGLFATYCSSNIVNGINLLNSMANLEYLEQELVPSVLVKLKKNDEICGISAGIYKDCWEEEETKFKKLLFGIIDANAFCSMIKEEIGQRIDKIQGTSSIPKETFMDILNPALLLLDFMSIASKNEQFNNEVQDKLQRIHLVARELGSGIEILHEPHGTNQRLLKRCKILKAEIKKLVLALRVKEFESENHEKCEVMEYSVSLNSLDRRGKSILEHRSILYRTQDVVLEESGIHDERTETNDFPGIVLSFRSKIENLTTELNITEILNGLSELSTR